MEVISSIPYLLSVSSILREIIKNPSANELQTSVDAYAKRAETIFEELVSVNNAIKRHEKWFEQIAKELNIKLEF